MLEVAVVEAGRRPAEALRGLVHVAQRVEKLGYRRVWYTEHLSSPLLFDFPPSVVIAHVAAATSTIRLGSGAVLAPNHVAVSIAEHFGTLEALHPGRIDLGIGRGPGTFDDETARALRRGRPPATAQEYGDDVAEILRSAGDRLYVPRPWLLCSNTVGATLAATLGLPMAFAHHTEPGDAEPSVQRYRDRFTPSRWSDEPQVMLSVGAICAETSTEAA